MKSIIGEFGLPYVCTLLPPFEFQADEWKGFTWQGFFTQFEDQFDEIKSSNLHGIVVKPRIGECGQGVIIIMKIIGNDNKPIYTLKAINNRDDALPTGKPSDLIQCKKSNKTNQYFVEPYMSGELEEHHFIIATAGMGMKVLYNCTIGVQLDNSNYHFKANL